MERKHQETGPRLGRQKLHEGYNFIIQKVLDYRIAKIIFVANYYDLFTLIGHGHKRADTLCKHLRTDRRATQLLLDALVSIKLLHKKRDLYHNAQVSKEYLVRHSPHYMGDNLKYQELVWDCWTQLKEVVRDGEPPFLLEDLLAKQDRNFVKNYIYGMDNIGKAAAEAIGKVLDLSRVRKMLDVGGGSGVYSMHFAGLSPVLQADILDVPQTLFITREIVSKSPVRKRIRLLEGNYLTSDFDMGYDLILMSHITHDEGEPENRLLFNKAYQALNPGGLLIIHDFLIGENKTGPLFPAIFSINMLVYTKKGRTYSWKEYKKWMTDAGFSRLKRFNILPHLDNRSSVLLGEKRP